ncbi:hypothetical protein [Serratia sp. JSRIV006]|uniref:hypothetical protein n=1 Tax=Serratia sp. JSRIV006 TaxID=2831896 RepID=UPI001CBFDDF9|nr:hypothetical protein [Serratia sp. JSRIV006]UAN64281.1 hypothetical protein KGP16_06815 [Serratia sp. JSRIV006]
MRKWLFEVLMTLSIGLAKKVYGEEITQVDIWLASGKQLMVMSRDEVQRLGQVAKELSGSWTQEEVTQLRNAIEKIRNEEGHGKATTKAL